MNKALLVMLLLISVGDVSAELLPISNDEMDIETGQAGVALSLEMRLNSDAKGNSLCGTAALPLVECRMAIGLNNRGRPGTDQEWLVLKGIFGRIYIPYLTLDADEVTYISDVDGSSQTISAAKLGFGGVANKVEINHLTISNMAMAYDSPTERGYNQMMYDLSGKETGFLGIEINGNVEMSGTLKIFPCSSNHPRC